MVKGFRREVVVVRAPDSDYIEEAYFVLRESAICTGETDLVAEANRIIENTKRGNTSPCGRTIRVTPVLAFLLGACSTFVVGAVALFFI